MDSAEREQRWRRALLIVGAISLVVCALLVYAIKRLEDKPKPHVVEMRQVNPVTVPPPRPKK